eukprot:3492502-Amphidinium_carterae.1
MKKTTSNISKNHQWNRRNHGRLEFRTNITWEPSGRGQVWAESCHIGLDSRVAVLPEEMHSLGAVSVSQDGGALASN